MDRGIHYPQEDGNPLNREEYTLGDKTEENPGHILWCISLYLRQKHCQGEPPVGQGFRHFDYKLDLRFIFILWCVLHSRQHRQYSENGLLILN